MSFASTSRIRKAGAGCTRRIRCSAPSTARGWSLGILSELWGLETTTDAAIFESKREAIAAKFARVEAALGSGPFFAGESFSLVDAVFAPIFRYFDVFDQFIDLAVFTKTPNVRKWRTELAKRPSVQAAVGPDYPELLRAFLVRYDAHLLKLAA